MVVWLESHEQAMTAVHVYSIRGPRLMYMLTGGCLAAIGAAIAATAPDNLHRVGAAVIAALLVLAAYLGWRCSRIVTSDSGVAITPNLTTRHFSWSAVDSFEYRVGPAGAGRPAIKLCRSPVQKTAGVLSTATESSHSAAAVGGLVAAGPAKSEYGARDG